jgi:FAD/FMN-containing dehydrogenase
LVETLSALLGSEKVFLSGHILTIASKDESDIAPKTPLCVVRPETTDDVIAVVKTASDFKVPITARGGGTSLEGSSIPAKNAIVVDFTGMDRIVECVVEERRVRVEPGVVLSRLNRFLSQFGLFFPPSTSGAEDSATIGGMVSTDASGMFALRYGATRAWVMALDVVTGRGDLLHLGRYVPKSSSGYSLKDIVIGSEGTLALVVGATLRVAPLPEARQSVCFLFEELSDLCHALATMSAFVECAIAIELMDMNTVQVLGESWGLGARHMAMVELAGARDEITKRYEDIKRIAQEFSGVLAKADGFSLRRKATDVIRERFGPVVRTDCALPLTRVSDFVSWVKDCSKPRKAFIFGHIGTGILHILLPQRGDGSWSRMEALDFKKEMAKKAVEMGGSISGEHGVGLGNKDILAVEHGLAIDYMRKIKEVFDPCNILNPDKVLP